MQPVNRPQLLCKPAEQPTNVEKIIEIGTTDNQVQEHLGLPDKPDRPQADRFRGDASSVCQWARDRFEKMGLENCRLEQWGEFPVGFERGPSQGSDAGTKANEVGVWNQCLDGRYPGTSARDCCHGAENDGRARVDARIA